MDRRCSLSMLVFSLHLWYVAARHFPKSSISKTLLALCWTRSGGELLIRSNVWSFRGLTLTLWTLCHDGCDILQKGYDQCLTWRILCSCFCGCTWHDSLFRSNYHTEHGILRGAEVGNDDLCLFNRLCRYRIGDFPAGTMKWNLFTKREWVLIPKKDFYYVNLVEKRERTR